LKGLKELLTVTVGRGLTVGSGEKSSEEPCDATSKGVGGGSVRGASVRNTMGRLRAFTPALTAVTVIWYCESGSRPRNVTESEFPATTVTTLKLKNSVTF